MAPPRHRDRGFSRRASNSLFFGYVAAAAGIVLGLGLLLVARFDPLAFQGIRGLALDLTAPFSSATRVVARGGDRVGGTIGDYWRAGAHNAELERQLAEARRALIQAQIDSADNHRLRRLLKIVGDGGQPVVVARIVGSNTSGQRRYATLAAGSGEGVRAGQPVRGPDGLIGRIAEAGHGYARVQLITDGGSTVPVRVVRTGQPALIVGRGDGGLDVRATTIGAQPFRRGDLLATSGTGGVFHEGLPVAVVTTVSGEVAAARGLADPATLDVAMVLPEVAVAPPPPPPVGAH
ncbi:rod shape-determining protein MreC [Sphingomonas vulcanisoli]|uniref:Cell shape-determining protein MreC n=1 Tax=Sphingomonas vulcanisoli TaxID=1658060 RepID=A0ABX0TTY7_9SPHN|nr:rod shape-determining protein MreC [Sphingomonas vulcanisoli]NIJ07624.1 rod shape-determining protein MreC [Sphingomonas vulcanisoli]